MKKKFLVLFTILLVSSCFVKKKEVEIISKPLVVENRFIDSTLKKILVSENNLDSSEFIMSYKFYKNEDSLWKKTANNYIADFLYTSTQFEIDTNKTVFISEQLFSNCLDTFMNLAAQEYRDAEFPMMWFYDGSAQIIKESENFISLSSHAYTFTGGAHPNGYQEFVNIDKSNGKILKLNDIVTDTLAYYTIAEIFFREAIQAAPEDDLDQLGYWFYENGFFCNDNFYIGENELVFYFNTYEIAPYSHGPTEFSVPFTLSNHLIKYNLAKK